jgi:hypothetical protein
MPLRAGARREADLLADGIFNSEVGGVNPLASDLNALGGERKREASG